MRREDRIVTSEVRIREILEEIKVARIGLNDEGEVYILPLNHGYVYENGKLTFYFHGANEGRKIDILKKNPKVGIELDGEGDLVEGQLPCQYSFHYASIIGKGVAEFVTDPHEKNKALNMIMKHQTGKTFDDFEKNMKLQTIVTIIKVEVTEFTAKSFQKK